MANEVNYSPCKYRGNGSTTEFSFDWKILNVEDVIVQFEDVSTGVQTTKQYGSDFTVIFNETGGHVTFNTAPSSDYYVIISRNVSDYQSKTYSTSTGFQGSEIENSFDRVSCNLQEVEYTLQRAIKVPIGSAILDLTLPLPDAGKTLKWNEDEDGLVNSTIDVDELESIANRLHESIDNIDTVAENILDVNDVADIQEDVTTVADIKNEVVSVAGIKNNVVAVDNNKTNINAVNANKTNIDTVANNILDVNDVADSILDVKDVADIKEDVSKVADIDDSVVSVAGIKNNVVAVDNNKTNINAVNANKTNIDTVANNILDVNDVADSIEDVNTCADNMTAILDAPNQAQTATEQAEIATDKANDCAVALAEAEDLRNSLQLFSCIDCGYFGDTQTIIHDAGTFDNMATEEKIVDCGAFGNFYIANEDIKNILNLPNLQIQVDNNEYALNKAIERVSTNEENIAESRSDIDDLILLTTEHSEDIEDIVDDIEELADRTSENEDDIEQLQYFTKPFAYIDCGYFGDTQTIIHDAGTFDNMATNAIDCGNFNGFFISREDLKNIIQIPVIQKSINTITNLIEILEQRLSSLEGGIDCGYFKTV